MSPQFCAVGGARELTLIRSALCVVCCLLSTRTGSSLTKRNALQVAMPLFESKHWRRNS
jgi:hypothetical protein